MQRRAHRAVLWTFRPMVAVVCLATVLPLFRVDEWWIRVLDFPRLQVACLGCLVLIGGICLVRRLPKIDRWGILLVGAAVLTQAIQIYPYTTLARAQVVRAREPGIAELRIFAANVLQYNRRTRSLLDLVASTRPDIILLTEVDPWWQSQLGDLRREFPHVIAHPLTNTYGIALYSRYELVAPEIRFLVEPVIPSIRADVQMPAGGTVRFFGVHPRPPGRPGPSGALEDTALRDAELVMIAREVRELNQPVIVAGDFNDVAWSHTTRLFQRISRLLDPRVGRGFYNTYNANYWFLRFPLDHLFHSEHFALAEFKRLPHIGSDHFPIFTVLRLSAAAPERQEAPPLKPGDPPEAQRKIREGTPK